MTAQFQELIAHNNENKNDIIHAIVELSHAQAQLAENQKSMQAQFHELIANNNDNKDDIIHAIEELRTLLKELKSSAASLSASAESAELGVLVPDSLKAAGAYFTEATESSQ